MKNLLLCWDNDEIMECIHEVILKTMDKNNYPFYGDIQNIIWLCAQNSI